MPELLWVEDEPAQLTAAEAEIQDREWNVTFQTNIVSAAQQLSTKQYHALILDLMVAGDHDGVKVGFANWGTYRLLCWLGGIPASAKAGVSEQWEQLDAMTPLAENRRIPAMILSAYNAPDVTKAMNLANRARIGIEIRLYSKPIDEVQVADALLDVVRRAGGEQVK